MHKIFIRKPKPVIQLMRTKGVRRARQGKGAEKAGRNEKAVSAQEDSILLSLAGTQRLQVCAGLGQATSWLIWF